MVDQLSFVSVEKLAASHKAQAGLCPHAAAPEPKDQVCSLRFCQTADRTTCVPAAFADAQAFLRYPYYLRHEAYKRKGSKRVEEENSSRRHIY